MTDRFMDIELSQARWLVMTSYLLALIIDTMVIMQQSSIIAPPFTLMTLLYWTAQLLKNTHFISAFILGLLMDAMLQSTLGVHSMMFIILTFVMLRYRLLFRSHSVIQQAFVVAFYLLFYQILTFLLLSPTLQPGQYSLYWSMPAIGFIIWPIIALTLRWLTQKTTDQ